MSHIISNLTTDQVTEVGELFWQVFGPNGCGEKWTPETALAHVQGSLLDTEYCFVAMEAEKIIGFVIAFPLACEEGTDLFIESIGVVTTHQGQGVGSDLIKKATELAKQNGLKGFRLMGHAKYPSYNWYNSLGLKETGWVELAKEFGE